MHTKEQNKKVDYKSDVQGLGQVLGARQEPIKLIVVRVHWGNCVREIQTLAQKSQLFKSFPNSSV